MGYDKVCIATERRAVIIHLQMDQHCHPMKFITSCMIQIFNACVQGVKAVSMTTASDSCGLKNL